MSTDPGTDRPDPDAAASPRRPDRVLPLPARVDLPALDHAVLDRWKRNRVFERSVEQNSDGQPWIFYEGPPTANGVPGVHHVESRVFKDLYPRFKTMKGYSVPRRGGWDCHGLPVELAVERELGFSGKPDIEKYGIAEFNQRCRESVQRHVDAFAQLTDRMGFWVDLDNAYWTMSTEYVESVWWSLKQVFDAGLLVQDHRITPYCPRCGTGLSDHEVAQGYETIVDPSVTVRLPVVSGPADVAGADLLIWTTTPWTLVSNTAVAVHPDVTYVVARGAHWEADERSVVVAEPLLAKTVGENAEVLATLTGSQLEYTTYERPLDLLPWPAKDDGTPEPGHFVVLAEYVTTEDGTGLVHQAPAFGAEDFVVCRAYGMPVVNPVRRDGTFEPDLPLVGGMFFKTADQVLVPELADRGVLYRSQSYEHPYPHCWRCHTPLIYYALPSWYIRTTAVKDALLRENEKTDWHPETIKHGRYGDWLENNIDWALSRDRYWGTPLPIWRNDLDPAQLVCVGSLAELGQLAGQELSNLDPHRPDVDDITFTKPGVEGTFRRVPQVIDAWYDSGSMPFAQLGYPHAEGSEEALKRTYPADFICEAIDQTRGWFYSLMAVGTAVFDASSYKTVLCLGHIVDAEGRKMSKHVGNVIEPIPLMDRHGADGLRWQMLCVGNPWSTRRVGDEPIEEVVRKVLLTYWNTASFLTRYADANDADLAALDAPAPAERPLLDRWVLSELHATVREVDEALEGFDSVRAGRRLTAFVDDLSNWYVRRSRRRFWDGDPAALATLFETLDVLTRLMAPFVPFVTDEVWHSVVAPARPGVPDSVHLAQWPDVDEALVDVELSARMALVRRLVDLGRSARTSSKVRTRQPLSRALIAGPGVASLDEDLRAEVAQELNVSDISALSEVGDELVDVTVKANFRSLGRKYGKRVQEIAAAIAAADPAAVASAARNEHRYLVSLDGESIEVTEEDLVITETPRAGWAVASDSAESVALDLTLTPELVRAGLAREAIRIVQEARKSIGLEITDRITLWWAATGEAAEALAEHGSLIGSEVLATGYAEASAERAATEPTAGDDTTRFWLERA